MKKLLLVCVTLIAFKAFAEDEGPSMFDGDPLVPGDQLVFKQDASYKISTYKTDADATQQCEFFPVGMDIDSPAIKIATIKKGTVLTFVKYDKTDTKRAYFKGKKQTYEIRCFFQDTIFTPTPQPRKPARDFLRSLHYPVGADLILAR
jgi:hypothetical protein